MSAILLDNLADAATITPSGALTLAPATNLQNEHLSVVWQVNSGTASLIFDVGSLQSMNAFFLGNVSGTNPDFRVRFSTVDATGVAGNAKDSGTIAGAPYFDPNFRKFVYRFTTPVSARYVRFDQTEVGATLTRAGRSAFGLLKTFGINFQAPHSISAVRRSTLSRGTGPSTFIDRKQGNWRQNMSFGFISETERTGFLRDLGVRVVNTGHADFLWIPDVDSTNLSADCLWGFHLPDEITLTQNLYVVPPVYSLDLQIEDRG